MGERRKSRPSGIPVYVEAGSKRIFAGAIDWPGWCRGAKTEPEALRALTGYRDRYAAAIAPSGIHLPAAATVKVVERLRGDATTDFGAPSVAPSADHDAMTDARLRRQVALLVACWAAFDAAAKKAARTTLASGPRGGGRTVAAMAEHVFQADRAYVSKLGRPVGAGADVHAAFREALDARNRGEPDRRMRATTPMWTPGYAIRRSAWHALDHAWEIEDRS
ncbi:MAG TPA: hypothetical protein VGB64_10645 [Actinomycetota bacterium]